MRREKLIALVSIIFILSLTVIFSNAKQDKRRRITKSSHQDIYSKNKFRPRRVRYNQKPHLINLEYYRQLNPFPSRNKRPRYVPGEIIVKFKMPLSDFDVAYLFGDIQPKIIGGRRRPNNRYLIRFPENVNCFVSTKFGQLVII